MLRATLLVVAAMAAAAGAAPPPAEALRVEYLAAALGIDTPAPRFSWKLPAGLPRGTAQAW